MDNLPVAATLEGGSRTSSPARPKALTVLQPRHNVTLGSKEGSASSAPGRKRSESAVMRQSRKKSPLPLRKGQTGDGIMQGSAIGLSIGAHCSRPHSVSHSGSQEETAQLASGDDSDVTEVLSLSTAPLGDSLEMMTGVSGDEVDGSNTPDINRARAAIDHLQQKIARTKEFIKSEQTSRDDNVNEYLKLASNADKQQLQRIKSVFEKKNQRSAQQISQLQKKLENYNKRIREVELYGVGSHRQPKEVLRDVSKGILDVGANIRDGISGFSGSVMSKPREFAHLIKNKFGSADNINNMTKPLEEGAAEEVEKNHHGSATFTHSTGGAKYPSEDDSSSITSGSGPTAGTGTMSSPRNQPLLSLPHNCPNLITSTQTVTSLPTVPSSSIYTTAPSDRVDQLLHQLHEKQEEFQQRLQEDIDSFKSQMQQEITYFHQALQEERYRYERLEEQMNDLIELHQNEIENLKQGISDMEEKVQYQSEERLRDMHEMIESFQTKISRMEHQQQQHQQLVTLEGIENSNARALVLKLINVLLTVLQVVLLLVATLAGILMPFLKTRVRVLTTSLLVVAVVLMCRQWPEIIDMVHHMLFGSNDQRL